jgi:hypothetical protein
LPVPDPTHIYRIAHIDNLEVILKRGGLHAPNFTPADGLEYRTIHNSDIQYHRRIMTIPCGPGGSIHDYVSFYFGPLSPMLLQLHTGRVAGYNETQEPIIYLVSTVQTVEESGAQFVFSDGHGIAGFTRWFSNPNDLDKVDWSMVNERYWSDNIDDMDRQRRKQAEFLIHKFCSWNIINEIGVINTDMQARARAIFQENKNVSQPAIRVRRSWYY